MNADRTSYVRRLAADIVAAHISHNTLSADLLPDVIRSVYEALRNPGAGDMAAHALHPAVPIKKSVFPDYIICLEDGQKLKMLKRHLKTAYGMTPDAYRAKWGLPDTYPMTASDYAARRSNLAKSFGFGRKLGESAPDETRIESEPAAQVDGLTKTAAAKSRGRKSGPKKAHPANDPALDGG